MTIALNLASGTDLRPAPWINLDIVPRWPNTQRGCDVIWDARKDPIPFHDQTVDEIYAGYLFLHLAPHHHERVLADIFRVMKPRARLVVGEVDFAIVMPRFLADPTDHRTAQLLWGEQGVEHGVDLAEFDKHCHGFTEASLRAFLQRGGFDRPFRISVHSREVWYELTLETFRP